MPDTVRIGRIVLLLVWIGAAREAPAQLPALDVGAPFTRSVGRDVDELSRVAVEGPNALDGSPTGQILLPPYPGGGAVSLPCSDFDPVNCFHVGHIATAIARSGQLLGRHIEFGSGGPAFAHAAVWSSAGTGTVLLAPLAPFFFSNQVVHGNASGHLVGRALDASFAVLPVRWPSMVSAAVVLANLGGGNGPFPVRIDDAGTIVGHAPISPRAVAWREPAYALEFLGELPGGTRSRALGIGDGGRIVGSSDAGTGTDFAVVWTPTGGGFVASPLPVPDGFTRCGEATAISDAGEIAGNCTNASGQSRGVLWLRTESVWSVTTTLEPLPAHVESAAYGLSAAGLAVGRSGPAASSRAVVWGAPPQVPSLSPAWLALLGAALAAIGALASAASRTPTRLEPGSGS